MTPSQFTALLDATRSSFTQSDPQPLDHPGLTGFDQFYPATGRFNLFRTCNVWVGSMLRQAEARSGIWTRFTWSLP